MKPEYAAWIAQIHSVFGLCREITTAMAEAFPELTRVRGHYFEPLWGERAHWWLTDSDGKIVDPTAAQFPSKGCSIYTPWTESVTEPTSICPNCGSYVYDFYYCCSKECTQAFIASLDSWSK